MPKSKGQITEKELPSTTESSSVSIESHPLPLPAGVYEVERIIKHRYRNGKLQFHVKWKGWSASHNTWEPDENIFCRHMIDSYREKLERKGKTLYRQNGRGRPPLFRKTENATRRSTRLNAQQPMKRPLDPFVDDDEDDDDTSATDADFQSPTSSSLSDETTTSPPVSESIQEPNEEKSIRSSLREPPPLKMSKSQLQMRSRGRPSLAQKRKESIINCYTEKLLPLIKITDITVNGSTCTFIECKKREGFIE